MTKRSLFRAGHRDDNEQPILDLLNARNIRFVLLRPGDGADLLVMISPMELWEVKNPDQVESKRLLTQEERITFAYCLDKKIPYFVIETVEDAAYRLNLYFERM
jgi:hypothetical protein